MPETSLTPEPVCPACGHSHADWWEWDFGHPIEGSAERECDSCGAEFKVEREVTVYFTTTAKPVATEDSHD